MAKRFFIENITENKQGISPSLSLKLSSYSKKEGTYLLVELPAYIWIGGTFSMTVTAKNADGTTDKQYKGDCTITENGAGTISPATIASTEWENGVVTKALVYLTSASGEITLTIAVTDVAKPWIMGSGTLEFAWQSLSGFDDPYGISFDPVGGYIYVIGPYDYIIKTKIDGSGQEQYGSMGSGVGQFYGVQNIQYVSGGYLYIPDTYNHRIVKCKMDGSVWETFGTFGSGVGQFDKLCDLHYDPASDCLYVTDRWNDRIVRCKMDGSVWEEYGTYGNGVGQFASPYGISFDPATGFVYVADRNNDRIVETKMDGTGWRAFGTSGSGDGQFLGLRGIHYDPASKYVYTTDANGHRTARVKMDGTGWKTFGSYGSGVGQFNIPSAIYFNASKGFIYVPDTGNDRIVRARIV